MKVQKVVAIDGPSGSGKSTLARNLAEHLNLLYVDTGAMYRALGLACRQRQVPFREGPAMQDFLQQIDFRYGSDRGVFVDGRDYTPSIRHHQVAKWASLISKLPSVRAFLLDRQRDLMTDSIGVMEGRDIGSVIFPQAFCKIFVTARVEIRAQRRHRQLLEQNKDLKLDEVLKAVEERDQLDQNRDLAPLVQTPDAVTVDTGEKTPGEVLSAAADIVRRKASQHRLALP